MRIKDISKLPEKLFRVLYINFFFGNLLFMITLGIFSLFGLYPVNFNDEQVYGIKGMIVLLVFTPFTTLVFVFLIWVGLKAGNKVINLIFRN